MDGANGKIRYSKGSDERLWGVYRYRLIMKGEGACKGVMLTMQDIAVVEDFLPFELGSSDVILGMKWLESLLLYPTISTRLQSIVSTLYGEHDTSNTAIVTTSMLVRCEMLGELGEDVTTVPILGSNLMYENI